ncbi:MAG TPA: molybdate ABC transporter substrate-binding protein [Pirellulaceae bacterium]|nr:molybdate ABC transporter substrate-binding protein [Pirellulaceae bacterium]
MKSTRRHGSANSFYMLAVGSLVLLGMLAYMLLSGQRRPIVTHEPSTGRDASQEGETPQSKELFVYCAAGMRYAMEKVRAQYEEEMGVLVRLQYGGSNTLLNQLEVNQTGDLYLAGDESYIRLAQEKGLAVEAIPMALMKPVIAVPVDNPKNILTIDDLLREDVKVALGDPGAAAIGKKCKRLLSASGQWRQLEEQVTKSGVFKPTVNDVANAIKLGSVDAGVIWDSTVAQYSELKPVAAPELDAGLATIEIAVVKNSKNPTAALTFARYLTARDKGQEIFRATGFEVLDGDQWSETPEITFFAGAVNRAALEPVIKEFERREGVIVNTRFDGCGILTSTMRGIRSGQAGSFPDVYMACDVYYLNVVEELFQDAVNISDTDIVAVTQKGNPKAIKSVKDLAKPGVRVVLGQPEKCTIGILSKRLLESEGLSYESLNSTGNLVNQTTSSALLVPQIATGAADVVLAYRTDTRSEASRLDIVELDSHLAKAIQPFSVARSSEYKQLGHRLYETIARSRDRFESRGFNWRLDDADLQTRYQGNDAAPAKNTLE